MLWPEMQIIANRGRGEVKTVSIDYEANVSNADTRTKTKITSQNQNITNKSSDAINPSNPGIIESEGNSEQNNARKASIHIQKNNFLNKHIYLKTRVQIMNSTIRSILTYSIETMTLLNNNYKR